MMRPVAAVAAALTVAACGGTPTRATSTSTTSASPGPATAARAVSFTDPAVMLAKLHAAGIGCVADSPAAYNAAAALSQSCHLGAAQETIYLDTFTDRQYQAEQDLLAGSPLVSRISASWAVSADSGATLSRVVAALTR